MSQSKPHRSWGDAYKAIAQEQEIGKDVDSDGFDDDRTDQLRRRITEMYGEKDL